MEEYAESTVAKEFLGKALRQVNKLNRLVSDLLEVSKIHAGKLQYNMIACRLKPLIRESVETVRQIYPSHKIECDLAPEDFVISADSVKIEQVLINFLTNAIKYSPESNKVNVSLVCEDDKVVVCVRDYGIGIPNEYLDQIFSRYFRINPTPAIGGLGIGLYISKEIISRHGGAIWAESTEGEGSAFYFSLPLPE